jgi:WD40 repeat protein
LESNTGQCIAGPFQGHTSFVTSVAYSPDGSHIVSGSRDSTIRVWNPTTGQCIAGPFQGHMEGVHSVAYSPDGSHIVSGSGDHTIRVWDLSTGQCIATLIQAYKADVYQSVESARTCFLQRKRDASTTRWLD